MTTLETLPVDQALDLIRRWAEHPWPMTQHQALALRDELGWTPDPRHPDEPRLFATNMGLTPGIGRFYFHDEKFGNVNIKLSSHGPDQPEIADQARNAFETYTQSLTALWGPPKRGSHRDVVSATWRTPSGALVELTAGQRIIAVDIESQEQRIIDEWAQRGEHED